MTDLRHLLLALSLVLLTAAPLTAQTCGNCDGMGSISIVDALRVAQLATGIITPTALDYPVCDVDATQSFSVIDALLIAQRAVGISVTLTCGTAPGNAAPVISGVNLTLPYSGDILVDYVLRDDDLDPCDLLVEVSTNGGATYTLVANQGAGGDGLTGLAADATGVMHVFSWDTVAQFGMTAEPRARLRLTAFDGSDPSSPVQSMEIIVDNRPPGVISWMLDIQPILNDTTPSGQGCVNCHAGSFPDAGLDLTSYTNLFLGSGSGQVVTPGDPDMSLIICKLEGMCGQQMPLGGTPWTPAQLQDFRDWITQGALDN